jgi:PAS domain S-box-containing protein
MKMGHKKRKSPGDTCSLAELPRDNPAPPLGREGGIFFANDSTAARKAQQRRHRDEYRRSKNRMAALLRKRMEGAGAFARERYRAIVEDQTEFIVRWTPDGRRTFANEAYRRYFKLTPKEALGTSFFPLIAKAQRQEVRSKIASLSPERPVAIDEHQVLRPDGSIGWHQWTDRALFDAAGRLVEIQSVGRDVTERREAEESLKRLSQIHRLALEAADLGVWDYDLVANRYFGDERCRRIFGVPEAESLSAEKVLEIIHPGDRERIWQAAQAAQLPLSDGRYAVEYRVVWPDGSMHWVLARGQASFRGEGEDRQAVRFTGLVLDVTERKRLELELVTAKETAEEANRAKSQFLTNMSHELRTPMTVILGYIQLLQEADPAPEQQPMLEMVHAAARRLLAIIDDVLDISRIEARRLRIEERPFDLRQSVRQAVELFAVQAREKGVDLRWEVASAIPEQVGSDPDRLSQILLNLISNAVKFTHAGEVAVTVTPVTEGLLFSVTDTGIGIPQQDLERIFSPFAQLDVSSTRAHGGTGLGLTICRELVALMGGRIWVESREGRGSRFSFILPLRGE